MKNNSVPKAPISARWGMFPISAWWRMFPETTDHTGKAKPARSINKLQSQIIFHELKQP